MDQSHNILSLTANLIGLQTDRRLLQVAHYYEHQNLSAMTEPYLATKQTLTYILHALAVMPSFLSIHDTLCTKSYMAYSSEIRSVYMVLCSIDLQAA